ASVAAIDRNDRFLHQRAASARVLVEDADAYRRIAAQIDVVDAQLVTILGKGEADDVLGQIDIRVRHVGEGDGAGAEVALPLHRQEDFLEAGEVLGKDAGGEKERSKDEELVHD